MSRYSRKDVDHAASELAKLLGVPLAIEAWSPGVPDRRGTRYRIYTEGDVPGSLGRQLAAECGAGPTTETIWKMIYGIREYKRYNPAPDTADATAQLHDIEAPPA